MESNVNNRKKKEKKKPVAFLDGYINGVISCPYCNCFSFSEIQFLYQRIKTETGFFETNIRFYWMPTLLILHKLVIIEFYMGGKGKGQAMEL